MDLVKSAVSFLTFRRIYRYLLKRVLGGIFIADFSIDQLDVQLYNGEIQLTDLSVNTLKLNALLDTTSLPLQIDSGTVGKVHVKIPWKSILKDKCKIYLSELYLRIRVRVRCSSGGRGSPHSSKSFTSPDVIALSKLVKQVVMNSEGYIETATVDCIVGDSIFRVRFCDILLSPDTYTLIQNTSIELLHSPNPILSIPEINVQILSNTLKISTDQVFIDIGTVEVLNLLLNLFSSLKAEDEIFHSVIESKINHADRLWYEEIYSVIEAEVIKGEEVCEEDQIDDFFDVLEETSIDIGQIQLLVGEIRVSLLHFESQLPTLIARFCRLRASPDKVNVEEYLVAMDYPEIPSSMFVSTMEDRDSSFESVSDAASVSSANIEEMFFGSGGLQTLFPALNQNNISRHNGELVLLHAFGISLVAGMLELESQLQVFLTPKCISHLHSVFALIKKSASGDQSHFGLRVANGFRVSIDLGNGHSISVLSDSLICVEKSQINIDSIDVFVDEKSLAIEIRNSFIERILTDVVNEAPKAEDPPPLNGWTAIGTQPVSTLKEKNPLCKKVNLDKIKSVEFFCGSEKIVVTNDPIVFLQFQLSLQSLMDQLSLETAPGSSDFGFTVNVWQLHCFSLIFENTVLRTVSFAPIVILIDKVLSASAIEGPPASKLFPVLVAQFGDSYDAVVRVLLEITEKVDKSISTNCKVTLRDLHFHVGPALIELVRFFAPPVTLVSQAAPLITAPPRPSYTLYTVCLENCWATLENVPGGLLLANIEQSFGVMGNVDSGTPVSVALRLGALEFWLGKGAHIVGTPVSLWKEGVAGLRLGGMVPLIKLENAQGKVRWQGAEVLAVEHFVIGKIRFDFKADSYNGLAEWLPQCLSGLHALNSAPPALPQEVVVLSDLLPPPVAAVLHVDDGWIRGRGGSRFRSTVQPKTESQFTPLLTSGTSRWFMDPKTLRVINDHLVDRKDGSDMQRAAEKKVRESKGALSMLSLDLHVKSVCMYFSSGLDWRGTEYYMGVAMGSRRDHHDYLCFEIEHAKCSLVDVFKQGASIERSLSVSIGDVRLRDGVCGSVFKYLIQGAGGPGQVTLSYKDSRVVLGIQPLAVSVDQDTLEFVNKFVRDVTLLGVNFDETDLDEFDETEVPPEVDDVVEQLEHGIEDDDEEIAVASEEDADERDDILFQSVQISTLLIEVNYKSKRVSMTRLRQGDPLQLLNLLPLVEDLKITFSAVKLKDVPSFFVLAQRLKRAWTKDIDRAQVLSAIRSVKPIRSITNLSTSMQDLIKEPLKQLKRGKQGHLSRGVLRGMSSFIRTLTIESLNLADVLVSSAQGTLEMIDHFMESDSQPDELVWEEDEESWTTVERGAGRSDPASAIEGIRLGRDALTRGIGMARLGPSLVLKPAIGTTQAISDVLRGTRSTVDSGKQRGETQRKFKEPWIAGDD